MKHLLLYFSLLILGCKGSIQSEKVDYNLELDPLAIVSDRYMTKLTELKKFNGVVLLKKDGEIVLKKAYNISKDSSSTLFVSLSSQFDLRSIAKLFAKISILELEKDGKINRKAGIDNYIKGFPNDNNITIEHLMNNTSGFSRDFRGLPKNAIELSPEDVVNLAKKEKLEFTPGTKEQYSNIGFQLLYYIIGKLNNATFYAYLEDTYFTPLNMINSGSNFGSEESKKNNYGFGHYIDKENNIVCECDFPLDEMRMGNLYSTVDDLNAFLSHLDSISQKDLIYNESISHAGGTRGKRAYIERNFVEDYTIIFLANYDAIPFEKLVGDLQSIVKGDSVDMPKAINRKISNVPTKLLKRYQGTYDFVDAGHIMLSIKFEDGKLTAYQKGELAGTLMPENDSTFFWDAKSDESFIFTIDEDGNQKALMDFQGVRWDGVLVNH